MYHTIFNYKILYEPIGLLTLQYNPQSFHYAIIHYLPGTRNQISTLLTDIGKKLDSIRPLDYQFYEDIAQVMDCPIGTVRSRIFRAREAIDEKLQPIVDSGSHNVNN